jgi:cytochrome d ubiquinol oxidase subunit II
MKTGGALARRAGELARAGSYAVVVLVLGAFTAVPFVQPALRHNYDVYPLGHVFPLVALLALPGMMFLQRSQRKGAAFAVSSLFIAALLGSAAWGLYPNLLLATSDPAYSLTIRNAGAGPYGLQVGLVWFSLGLTLAVGYTVYVYWSFRGKIEPLVSEENHY